MDLCQHKWRAWRPVPHITDMLFRDCPVCGARDIRVLGRQVVRPGPGFHDYDRMEGAYDHDRMEGAHDRETAPDETSTGEER